MVTKNQVNIGSGNGLLPDGTKPLPKFINVDLSSVKSSDNHPRAILKEIPQPLINDISLKITQKCIQISQEPIMR